MMLQKIKSHAGKMKVVVLSLLLATSMLYVGCDRDGKSSETLTDKKVTMEATEKASEYDVAPEFDGDLMQYLSTTIKYPKEAEAKKIEGKVMVRFSIDETGKVGDINVLRSPDDILSRSATEVVAKMPNWRPGSKDGKPVKVQYTLPIVFKMDAAPTGSDKKG